MGVDLALQEGERWYVVHTLPYKEPLAQAELANQDFRSFFPRLRKERRHARKVETVLAPFFPRYLFVILNLERDMWRSVNGTRGVSRLIMQSERPQPVPGGVIENLVECVEADSVLCFNKANRLRVGQEVTFISGPFVGNLAVIERLDGNDRIKLLLDIMNCNVRVNISGDEVVPLHQ